MLRPSGGLLFIDLETCCRGPIEVGALYAGADPSLVHDCWILMLAIVTAGRCEPGDNLPIGRGMALDWIRQLRAALGP